MNVLTLYFTTWLVEDLGRSNTVYATASATASVLVVLTIPAFGALSDLTQRRKPWVIAFTLLAAAGTLAIALIGQRWLPVVGVGTHAARSSAAPIYLGTLPILAVMTAFTLANYGHQGAQPFYNAMLAELAPPAKRGRLSGLAEAFAYSGAIIGVLLTLPFFTGSIPGLGAVPAPLLDTMRRVIPMTSRGGRVSTFVPTVILYVAFSLPLFFFCRDHNATRGARKIPWRDSYGAVKTTVIEAKRYPGVIRFILTSFLYQDAMGTIIAYMALYAVFAMGFTKGSEATLLVVLTIPAVFGSYLIGRLVDRIGPKRTLVLILSAWIVLLLAMILAPSKTAFWIVGALIGFIYGGIWTAERPMVLTLVPDEEAGRFFSLMVLSGRAAAIVGPFIWALTVDHLSGPLGVGLAYRLGVVTVMLGMLGSLFFLRRVPDNFSR